LAYPCVHPNVIFRGKTPDRKIKTPWYTLRFIASRLQTRRLKLASRLAL
jgi:hypothetical protein